MMFHTLCHRHQRQRLGIVVTTALITLGSALCIRAETNSIVSADFSSSGTLVVFISSADQNQQREFYEQWLPQIEATALMLNTQVCMHNVSNGSPEEMTITPSIYFQNARGRSLFTGRYTQLEQIERFILDARANPLTEVQTEHENVPVWLSGRAAVLAPFKISRFHSEDSKPAELNEVEFFQRAHEAVLKCMRKFEPMKTFTARRIDRCFQMEFEPTRLSMGKLGVGVALFSPFDSIQPVFRQEPEQLQGEWSEWEELFQRAARLLEEQIFHQMSNSETGDAFLPVPIHAPIRSWDQLNLSLPAALESRDATK
ncbi:hypothetical protein JXA32_11000 [Candidatus Sumerlaeota bacterium]|nr:hypothetical protein [Candidatus Sumerlaeota bacterium]